MRPIASLAIVRKIPISRSDNVIEAPMLHAPIKGKTLDMLAVIKVVLVVLDIAWWIVIASAILSWLLAFNILDQRNQFVRTVGEMLYRMTEPLYRPIRRVLPNFGGLDLSPLVVLLIIIFLQTLISLYVVPAVIGAGI